MKTQQLKLYSLAPTSYRTCQMNSFCQCDIVNVTMPHFFVHIGLYENGTFTLFKITNRVDSFAPMA